MIGADIYGWAVQAADGRLSADGVSGLRRARDDLIASLDAFGDDARPYYELLADLAAAALPADSS